MNFTPHPVGFTANVHRDAIAEPKSEWSVLDGIGDVKLGILSAAWRCLSFDPATVFRVASEAALQQSTQTNYFS
jgi:hypothetical protein